MSDTKYLLKELELGEVSARIVTIPARFDGDGFTDSEQDIIQRLINDESYRAIAEARGTAQSTVASQIGTIFERLDVSSTTELLAKLASQR